MPDYTVSINTYVRPDPLVTKHLLEPALAMLMSTQPANSANNLSMHTQVTRRAAGDATASDKAPLQKLKQPQTL